MFIGTPHRGSHLATYGVVLSRIANLAMRTALVHRITKDVRTSLIKTLERDSPQLEEISNSFRWLVDERDFHIISLYETETHPLVNDLVREPASCRK